MLSPLSGIEIVHALESRIDRSPLAVCLAAVLASLWIAPSGMAAATADSEIVPIERDFIVRQWRREHGLPDDRILSLLPAGNGFLWAGTRRGLARFDGLEFVTWSRSTHDVFADEECRAIAEAPDVVLWIATREGLVELNEVPKRHSFKHLPDSRARLWSPGGSGQIFRCRQGERIVTYDLGFLGREGVVLCMAEGTDGNLWLGTANQGLVQLLPRTVRTLTQGLPNENACSGGRRMGRFTSVPCRVYTACRNAAPGLG